VWATVREALRGTHRHDYTDGPIGRAVVLLAVPMVMEVFMESVFALVDVFFVSKLGADAVAAVAMTESMMMIIYALVMGLAMGAGALVARRIGEKDPEAASHTAVQAITLGVACALPVAAVGIAFAPDLLRIMGAEPRVIATGRHFTATLLGGNVTVVLLFLINAVFRGSGDAAVAMRVLWLANFINIALNPCLIFGLGPFPQLGVTGSAVATTIGRGTGVLFQLWILARGGKRVVVARRHLGIDLPVMGKMLRVSGTGILQAFIGTTSWIGLIRILASFGSTALAGYLIGLRIMLFALLPSWGMANAAATMVGQNLGAGKPDRAETAVWRAGLYNLIFLGCVSVVFVAFPRFFIHLFTRDPDVVRFGVQCLQIVSCGFMFYAYGMVMTSAFNGAGDTWTPTVVNLFCLWLWEIPLAYVLARPLGVGPKGVYIAITIAFSTLAVTGVLLFRRGKWKEKKV
jgi:putative MATE family efflux protein